MACHIVLSFIFFLFIESVYLFCDDVFSKRFSKEFVIVKNRTLRVSREDCLSGIILQSKFDSSFYCVAINPNTAKSEKLTCFKANSLENCECGKENTPPSSSNRIMYPTGATIIEFMLESL